MIDPTLSQAVHGEFDPDYLSEARSMIATEFASRHGATVGGTGIHQHRVTVGGVDYFWNASTGSFDGWGRTSPTN